MSQPNEPQSFGQKVMHLLRHEIAIGLLIVVVFAVVVAVGKGLIATFSGLDSRTLAWATLAIFSISLMSAFIGLIFAKRISDSKLAATIKQLDEARDDLLKTSIDLKRQIHAVKDLSISWDKLSKWTVAESHVLEIERDWKGMVLVVVPDLYYELEQDSELPSIIAENICKHDFKGYVYFLPVSHESQFDTLRKRIKRDLSVASQPAIHADKKLLCCAIPMNEFPFAATAGVVLYTDSDERPDFAFSHLPIDFPTSHLNIQLNRDDEHKFYSQLKSNLRGYLKHLEARFPPQ